VADIGPDVHADILALAQGGAELAAYAAFSALAVAGVTTGGGVSTGGGAGTWAAVKACHVSLSDPRTGIAPAGRLRQNGADYEDVEFPHGYILKPTMMGLKRGTMPHELSWPS